MSFATVVLADPNDFTRGDFGQGLEVRHHTVVEAKDVATAHQQFRKLMDAGEMPILLAVHALPQMDGLKLAADIRKEYGMRPVIIIRTDDPLPQPVDELGIDHLLLLVPRMALLRNTVSDWEASQRGHPRRAASLTQAPAEDLSL